MKRFMLNTFLLSLAVALWGCGGSDDSTDSVVTITASQQEINAPAEGGTYTIDVKTTGKEWGAYSDNDFVTVQVQGVTSQQGSATITISAYCLQHRPHIVRQSLAITKATLADIGRRSRLL